MITYFYNENSLIDTLSHIKSVDVIINNQKRTYQQGEVEYVDIFSKISHLFQNSCLIPALGVALHEEVISEKQQGYWLQINFDEKMVKNDLIFKSLLFKLEKTSGINLIRLNDFYDGRCLYLMFNQEEDLMKIIKEKN